MFANRLLIPPEGWFVEVEKSQTIETHSCPQMSRKFSSTIARILSNSDLVNDTFLACLINLSEFSDALMREMIS